MHRTLVILFMLALSLGLVSAATVSGKVVDADGKPIKGANVLGPTRTYTDNQIRHRWLPGIVRVSSCKSVCVRVGPCVRVGVFCLVVVK